MIRTHQWISERAVVLGLEAEIFHADAFDNTEKVLDLAWLAKQPKEAGA